MFVFLEIKTLTCKQTSFSISPWSSPPEILAQYESGNEKKVLINVYGQKQS